MIYRRPAYECRRELGPGRRRQPFAKILRRIACLFGALMFGAACSAPQKPVPAAAETTLPLYLIGYGWHAGIAVPRTDLLPEAADFPGADYLEFGWGDRDYYQAGDPGVWLLLQAACCSAAGLLHVAGVQGDVGRRFAGLETVRLEIPRDRFVALVAFIRASFQRGTGAAKALPLRRGSTAASWFYPAAGGFHLFNNCNTWVARGLEAAGYSLGWPLPFTTGQLLARARRLEAAEPAPPP